MQKRSGLSLFWFLPVIIFIFQAVYTFTSMNQIRLEEVIETFRSPWWFQNRLVWNGTYEFIGWSSTLVFFYKIFGMWIFTPKLVKLAFELVSFFCLAAILKKYLGEKRAWLPLLLVGLSPTIMYFNQLQLSMGIEVSYFFICLYLISKFKSPWVWSVVMFGWLNYFGFMFYLPILGAYYLYLMLGRIKKKDVKEIIKKLILSILMFLLPLLLMFVYINNRQFLIYDSATQEGLFRSYASFGLKKEIWQDTSQRLFKDLFVTHASYYFEQKKVEFSDMYPVFAILAVCIVSLIIIKKDKKLKNLVLFLTVLLTLYLFLIASVGPKTLGGIRRGTVLLVLFYGLVAIAWNYILSQKWKPVLKFSFAGALLLLLVHHIIVYPENLAYLKNPSQFEEQYWFKEKPKEKSKVYIEIIQKQNFNVVCIPNNNPYAHSKCDGLSLIYSALSGMCYFNKLQCHKIIVFDPATYTSTAVGLNFWDNQLHVEP